MAKRSTRSTKPKSNEPGAFEQLGKKIDEIPEVQTAEEAVQRAREQLAEAQKKYADVRRDAVEGMRSLREQNLGDLCETTLTFVRKHPAAGLSLAALVGFLMGRIFRR